MAGMKGIHLKPLLSFKILQVHKSVKHTELCLVVSFMMMTCNSNCG